MLQELTIILCIILLFKLLWIALEIRNMRAEMRNLLHQGNQLLLTNQHNAMEQVGSNINTLQQQLDYKVQLIHSSNAQALEKMRLTVEEKLYDNLDKKLGSSFKIVSDKLEQVFRGLGEMQNLAVGVGDLKKVLSNVKVRGVWSELQLENILGQIMHPSQYAMNVITKVNSNDRVEFAIKIPDKNGDYLWLPIDAKFPLENYQRLIIAKENTDMQQIAHEVKLLESFIKTQAKQIHDKYIDPRATTDFAIMFLPIEGLYLEVQSIPGLVEHIQHKYKVLITSANNMVAILYSLQLGFRTIAIQERSNEVWQLLASVKNEFGKFATTLHKTKSKLEQASQSIEEMANRSQAIHHKLENATTYHIENDQEAA